MKNSTLIESIKTIFIFLYIFILAPNILILLENYYFQIGLHIGFIGFLITLFIFFSIALIAFIVNAGEENTKENFPK